MANNSQNDDFFRLLEQEQKIANPFAADEILFADENGNFKVLKGQDVSEFKHTKKDNSELSVNRKVETVGTALPAAIPVTKSPPKLVSSSTLPSPVNPLDQEVNAIIKEAGLSFSRPEEEKRFRNIVISRLKNVRGSMVTREILLSSSLAGGMGFDSGTTDKVLAIINNKFNELENGGNDVVLNSQSTQLPAQVPTRPAAEEPEKFEEPPKPDLTLRPEIEPVAPQILKPVESIAPALVASVKETKVNRLIKQPDLDKPVVQDVKFKPHLTGPVEEISSMTLVDFRRLAPKPEQATKKIIEKIDLLEQDSFALRIAGIKAWRQSEVYKLYLDLADQAMEERKPIYDIIAQRQALGRPTLSQAELEAIIELNQKLRY